MNGIWYPWSETDGKGNSINGNSVGRLREDVAARARHLPAGGREQPRDLGLGAEHRQQPARATHKVDGYLDGALPRRRVRRLGRASPATCARRTSRTTTSPSTTRSGRASTSCAGSRRSRSCSPRSAPRRPAATRRPGSPPSSTALAKPENDDIIGFSWFNLAVTSYVEGVRATNDWRIDSRADTLSAFIDGPHPARGQIRADSCAVSGDGRKPRCRAVGRLGFLPRPGIRSGLHRMDIRVPPALLKTTRKPRLCRSNGGHFCTPSLPPV